MKAFSPNTAISGNAALLVEHTDGKKSGDAASKRQQQSVTTSASSSVVTRFLALGLGL